MTLLMQGRGNSAFTFTKYIYMDYKTSITGISSVAFFSTKPTRVNTPHGFVSGDTAYYYITDQRGSVRLVINGATSTFEYPHANVTISIDIYR